MALIVPTACVAKRSTTDSSNSTSNDADRIAALETKVSQLQSKIASLPTSSGGNYDSDIDNIYAELESLNDELDNILDEVDTMLADWEDTQDANSNTNTDTDINPDAIGITTQWSLDAWTDHESYNLLNIVLDSKKIEDGDDYTIWLELYNTNIKSSYLGKFSTALVPSTPTTGDYYYDTDTQKMYQYTGTLPWVEVSRSSIYSPVEIKEIAIQFSPKSSDRVVVDESRTELYSTGYPSFDWNMDYSNRTDGTCKRMEATTETHFTIPVPTKFTNNDPEMPYPEEFKLEFELTYKQ